MKRIKYGLLLAVLLLLLAGCNQKATPQDTYVLPTFQLELTQEQTEQFASGKFYILRQFGRDRFLPFYGSENVRLEGNRLIADFNGKVLYVANDSGVYTPVEALAQETVDGTIQHQTRLTFDGYLTETGETVDYPTTFAIYLAHNTDTGKLVNSRVTDPYDADPVDLLAGEYTPLTLPQAQYCTLSGGDYCYITRDENGQPLPLSQWERTGGFWAEIVSGLGADLRYGDLTTATAPIATAQGSVVLVFEVTNKDDSRWCSEPITVPLREDASAQQKTQPPLQVNWVDGNRIQLLEKEGATVILRKDVAPGSSGISYALELKNDTAESLWLSVDDIVYNGTVQASSGMNLRADGNAWGKAPFSFHLEAGEALQSPLKSISFRLELTDDLGVSTLWEHSIEVTLSPETAITPYWVAPAEAKAPCREFLAQEDQVLLEQDGLRFTLLCMGDSDNSGRMTWSVAVENTAQEPRTAQFGGLILNGTFLATESTKTLQPGQICYYQKSVSADELDENLIREIHCAALLLGVRQQNMSGTTTYCPIAAAAAAPEPAASQVEGTLLWEAQQIRVYLQAVSTDLYGSTNWQLVVENNSDQTQILKIWKAFFPAADGAEPENASARLSNSMVAAHSRVYTQLSCRTDGQPLQVQLRLLTEDENTILYTEKAPISLPMP